ncbi:MAG: hypothetical protein HZA79_05075 [Sphingobacteriales bacterium]|nr:hypothetical protein [Sphingobacteriales bacterium]
MAKDRERFNHGEHNEELCNLLVLNQKFPDWTITTAFYASLHFVSYKLFPFSAKVGSDKTQKFQNFDEWYSFKKHTERNKHELLKSLVATHCPEIHPEYDWLFSMAWTARYHNYQHDQAIVVRAVSNMQRIKRHCQP